MEESIFEDGTVIRIDKNQEKTMEFPNGQREIHTKDYKVRKLLIDSSFVQFKRLVFAEMYVWLLGMLSGI